MENESTKPKEPITITVNDVIEIGNSGTASGVPPQKYLLANVSISGNASSNALYFATCSNYDTTQLLLVPSDATASSGSVSVDKIPDPLSTLLLSAALQPVDTSSSDSLSADGIAAFKELLTNKLSSLLTSLAVIVDQSEQNSEGSEEGTEV